MARPVLSTRTPWQYVTQPEVHEVKKIDAMTETMANRNAIPRMTGSSPNYCKDNRLEWTALNHGFLVVD